MLLDRKTRSDHRYQLSYRYPSVIRTLSRTLSTSTEDPWALFSEEGVAQQICSPTLVGAVVVAFYCERSDSRLVKTTFLQIGGREGFCKLLNFPPQAIIETKNSVIGRFILNPLRHDGSLTDPPFCSQFFIFEIIFLKVHHKIFFRTFSEFSAILFLI